jgi:hypothetical protein
MSYATCPTGKPGTVAGTAVTVNAASARAPHNVPLNAAIKIVVRCMASVSPFSMDRESRPTTAFDESRLSAKRPRYTRILSDSVIDCSKIFSTGDTHGKA